MQDNIFLRIPSRQKESFDSGNITQALVGEQKDLNPEDISWWVCRCNTGLCRIVRFLKIKRKVFVYLVKNMTQN